MTTLLFFISLIGFFLLYNTSKKVKLKRSFLLEEIAQKNPKYSKITGMSLISLALIGSILYWGMGAGIFAFFVVLMTVGSAVVLMAPLKYLRHKLVAVLFVVSFIVELIF